ncbi:type II secretion system F family protein [Stenotrophomonas sp. STK17_22]|uniref:type II secretion system F family protein n=1 Tax=Stenotrophomonas sp. STK17_22 TaxID=3455201 RepID=UPI003F81198A
MSLSELGRSASHIRSQISTGIPLATAVDRLVKAQPKYGAFWAATAKRMRSGATLSSQLAGVWPAEGVAVVRAGELSGRLPAALDEFCTSVDLRRRLAATAKKLYYPAGVIAASILITLGIFAFVVPTVAKTKASASGTGSGITGFAAAGAAFQGWLVDHWLMALVASAGVVFAMVHWLSKPAVRAELYSHLLALPVFGSALSRLSFGLWTKYVAICCGAGLSLIDALQSTVDVLPDALRPGVHALIRDLNVHHKPLGQSVDPEILRYGDPRLVWPDFVSDAFMRGEETGQLDVQLGAASRELVRSGEEDFERALGFGNALATVIAGVLIGASMLITYGPVFSSMSRIR